MSRSICLGEVIGVFLAHFENIDLIFDPFLNKCIYK